MTFAFVLCRLFFNFFFWHHQKNKFIIFIDSLSSPSFASNYDRYNDLLLVRASHNIKSRTRIENQVKDLNAADIITRNRSCSTRDTINQFQMHN